VLRLYSGASCGAPGVPEEEEEEEENLVNTTRLLGGEDGRLLLTRLWKLNICYSAITARIQLNYGYSLGLLFITALLHIYYSAITTKTRPAWRSVLGLAIFIIILPGLDSLHWPHLCLPGDEDAN
jgi:hypothetical protein